MDNTHILYKIAEYIKDYKTFQAYSMLCKTAWNVCKPVIKYLSVPYYIDTESGIRMLKKENINFNRANFPLLKRSGVGSMARPFILPYSFIISRGDI